MSFELLSQPRDRLVGDRLIAELARGRWEELRCAVAFAKVSGVQYLDGPLRAFASGGGRVSISVGVDHDGTSFEAVSQLLGAVGPGGAVFVVKHLGSPSPTFHPKVFLFSNRDRRGRVERAVLISGSTNLTEGGLFTNYELASVWTPDLADPQQARSVREAGAILDAWADTSTGLCVKLDANVLLGLHKRGWLPTEEHIAAKHASGGSSRGGAQGGPPSGMSKQSRPPKVTHSKNMGPPAVALAKTAVAGGGGSRRRRRRGRGRRGAAAGGARHRALVIDISTTKKTEVFLAKTALADDAAFFGHPFQGLTTPRRSTSEPQPERDPRPVVDILLIGASGEQLSRYIEYEVKLWEYVKGTSANMDVRMIIPQALLRSLPSGCILEMRRSPVRDGLDYCLEFLTPGSTKWTAARAVATQALPNSQRRYGWL